MGKLIEIITEHVIPFKTFIEGLKDILNDVNFEIIQDSEMLNINTDTANENKKKKSKVVVSDSESDSDSEDDEVDDSDEDEDNDEEDKNKNKNENAININTINKKQKDFSGIKITTLDSAKTIFIDVKLDSKQFSKFVCKKKNIDLGINLVQFHKLIKSLDKDDILSMYINEDDRQNLIIKVSNPEKKYETTFKLKLMEINKKRYDFPDSKFEAAITFETGEFHRICREMSHIAEYIEIKCTRKTITYSCKGDCSERSTTFYTADDTGVKIRFTKNSPEIIQGIFELRNLILFSKYSNLCGDIQIFMNNNYPLCINYTIATLGRMYFCLSPIREDNIRENYEDEDEDYDEEEVVYK